jgi:hypothetical protein
VLLKAIEITKFYPLCYNTYFIDNIVKALATILKSGIINKKIADDIDCLDFNKFFYLLKIKLPNLELHNEENLFEKLIENLRINSELIKLILLACIYPL